MGTTTAGTTAIALALSTDILYLELGTGTTAFAANQTTLVTPITDSGLARALATTNTPSGATLTLGKTWTASGTKTVTEVGTFSAVAAGTMFTRSVLPTPRALESGYTYALMVVLTFS